MAYPHGPIAQISNEQPQLSAQRQRYIVSKNSLEEDGLTTITLNLFDNIYGSRVMKWQIFVEQWRTKGMLFDLLLFFSARLDEEPLEYLQHLAVVHALSVWQEYTSQRQFDLTVKVVEIARNNPKHKTLKKATKALDKLRWKLLLEEDSEGRLSRFIAALTCVIRFLDRGVDRSSVLVSAGQCVDGPQDGKSWQSPDNYILSEILDTAIELFKKQEKLDKDKESQLVADKTGIEKQYVFEGAPF